MTNNPQLSDRQQKLRNYHARKVAEKRQQQQQASTPGGSAAGVPAVGGSAAGQQLSTPSTAGAVPSAAQRRQSNNSSNSNEPKIELSSSQKARQRSLFKNTTGAAAVAPKLGGPSTDDFGSRKPPGYNGGGYGSASSKQQQPPPSSSFSTPATAPTASVPPSVNHRRGSNSSSSVVASGKGRTQHRGQPQQPKVVPSKSSTTTTPKAGNMPKGGGNMTSAQRAAYMASQRRGGVKAENSSDRLRGDIAEISRASNVVEGGKAHSTIGHPSLDSRANNSNSTASGASSSSAPSMKRLFAARRRRAQMEMATTAVLNTSVTSATSVTSDASGATNTTNVSAASSAVDRSVDPSLDDAKSVGTVATMGTLGTTGTMESSSNNSTRSNRSSGSTYNSRRALDRYLGRSGGSSSSKSSGSGKGGGSGGSKSSMSSVASGMSAMSAVSGMSGVSGNNGRESAASAATSVTGGSTVGTDATSSNGSGNISLTSSADSMDNHTISSLPSRAAAGGDGGNNGTSLLSTVKEESFHSMATCLVDNTSRRSFDEDDEDERIDAAARGSAAASAAKSSATNATGILRERSYSKEDVDGTTATTGNDGDHTTDEHQQHRASMSEKSVRFHLSPLEKMQREKRERQERNERERQRQEKKEGEKRERSQCSPPRSSPVDSGVRQDSIGDEHRVFASPGAGRLGSASSAVAENVVEEGVDMEFTMFVAGLRREVAGDHRELWSGFQSLLGRPIDEQVPLHESHVDETPSVQEYDRNGKKKKKKKKVRMDPQTQKSLTTIHKHLMENGRVKGKFMTTSSQLVNDKKVKKDRSEERERSGEAESSSSRQLAKSEEERSARDIETKSERNEPSRKSRGGDASSSSKHSQSSQSSTQSPPSNGNQQDIKQERLQSYREKKLSQLSSRLSPSDNSNDGRSLTSGFANIKLRSVSRANSIGSRGSQRSAGSDDSTASAGKQKLSWMEALKKKQKSLRLKQLTEPEPDAVEDRSRSPAAVMLRRVSPRKRQRMTPPSTPRDGQRPAAAAAPWAGVQLRSTPKKRESMTPTIQPTTNNTLPPVSHAALHSIQPSGSWNSASSVSSAGRIAASTPKQSTEVSSSLLPPLCCVGDIIDLNSLPKKVFPTEEGEAAIFSLKKSGKDLASKEESDKVVIVGKTAIVTASTTSPRDVSGPCKASVTWWCRRSEIRALTLNVEATGANLAHAHGRTPLLFESADVCLDFAQAFYRGPTSKSVDSSGAEEQNEVNSASDNTSIDLAPSLPPGKNLTEDEASLLDRYRQYSQSDRTKLRLTCLSPRGEMQEMEVSLSPSTATTKSSKAIDEKAVEKYRKMMKMGVPADAVRHKMETEGVDSNTINAVFDESSGEKKDTEGQPSLSEEEEKIASKYRKMLKMGIPPDAVRHKMTSDDIQQNVVAAVLGETKTTESQGQLTEEEEKTAGKYRNMIKMGVPADGVRHKMNMEGVDAKIISAVFDDGSQEQAKPVQASQLSSEEEVICNKYRKMLKMGVPLEGVEHKMKQDDVDLKIISVLVREASPSSSDTESAATKPSKQSTKSAGPKLSKEEEATASKYRNMLKVCIPKDAVRHKMQQEGVSDKIMEAVLGKEKVGGGKLSSAVAPPKANNRKTIAFHWTTSNLAPELLEQSIFGKTELKKRKLASINPEESDIKKLEELFQKRNSSKTATIKASGQGDASNDMAKLLDLTRANNIAISLKAFNDFTFRSLAETINDLDPDCKIVGERVQFIPNLLPTPKEIQAIKKYKGDDDKLITAEIFFRQLVPIKRIEDKVKVMRTMSTFEEHAEEARAGFKTLQEVCSQVMNSEKLIQILDMVLNIGNLMNAGTLDGGVEAFKFESLPKLSQTKSADGKTTVLDYIVETFIEKDERQALLLLSEFPDIQDSSRLFIGDLIGDLTSLKNGYKLCKTELTSMKRDQSSKRVTRSMSKKIKNESEVDDPRKALFAAIQSRKKEESPKKPPADPRQALFAAIKNQTKDESPGKDCDSPASDVKHTPGVHRLQKFLSHSKSILSLAEKDRDAAIRACKGLAVYCGEDGGERSAAPLLQVLADFALSLENGVKKYDKRIEAEKKKAAKKKKEAGKENTQNIAPASNKLLKVSALQPHVGVIDKAKTLNNATNQQGKDPMNAILTAIKDRASPKRVKSPITTKSSNDPQQASLASIRNSRASPAREKAGLSPRPKSSDPKDALLASIKSRRESLPLKPPPDGVAERVKHINNSMGRKESRVLLVNRMLLEAPDAVRQDFLKGVTYKETSDPLLMKIYEKEFGADEGDGNEEKKYKPVDPRNELFAAIRSRKTN